MRKTNKIPEMQKGKTVVVVYRHEFSHPVRYIGVFHDKRFPKIRVGRSYTTLPFSQIIVKTAAGIKKFPTGLCAFRVVDEKTLSELRTQLHRVLHLLEQPITCRSGRNGHSVITKHKLSSAQIREAFELAANLIPEP